MFKISFLFAGIIIPSVDKDTHAFCCWEALEQRTKLNKQKFFSHERVKCDKIE